MTSLKETIRGDLTTSMKNKDTSTTSTLRMLLAAIQAEETSSGTRSELSDSEVVTVIAREIKKRNESVEIYRDNDRHELADKEQAEIAVLEKYQPRQLDDEELGKIVDQAIADVSKDTDGAVGMKQMGQVMKSVKAAAEGQADGKRMSEAVKARLSGTA